MKTARATSVCAVGPGSPLVTQIGVKKVLHNVSRLHIEVLRLSRGKTIAFSTGRPRFGS